jgi:hypothetical protein
MAHFFTVVPLYYTQHAAQPSRHADSLSRWSTYREKGKVIGYMDGGSTGVCKERECKEAQRCELGCVELL